MGKKLLNYGHTKNITDGALREADSKRFFTARSDSPTHLLRSWGSTEGIDKIKSKNNKLNGIRIRIRRNTWGPLTAK